MSLVVLYERAKVIVITLELKRNDVVILKEKRVRRKRTHPWGHLWGI